MIEDEQQLRASLGEVLGLPGPYGPPPGDDVDTFHVHGGAVDPSTGRMAWVEELQRERSPALVDASLELRVADRGGVARWWDLFTYNPYFGCVVSHVRWWGDRVLVVYSEKHLTLVAFVDADGGALVAEAHEDHVVLDDRVVFRSQEPGLLETLSLPGLERGLPLPYAGRLGVGRLVVEDRAVMLGGKDQEEPGRVRLPSEPGVGVDRAALRRDLTHAAFGPSPPQPLADLLVGSLTYPFWLDRGPAARASYAPEFRPWASPRWLPVYWVQQLEPDAREEALETIDSLASCAASAEGWDPDGFPEDGALRLALDHLRRRCPPLAEACRTGRLPAGSTPCQLWAEWSRKLFARVALDGFPEGFREVFRALAADPPQALKGGV